MPLRAGHCTGCGVEVWKHIAHPKTKERFPLWPRPTSRYAVIAVADGTHARGLAYCATCGPKIGEPAPEGLTGTVARYDAPHGRYAYYLSPGYGTWLRAWLRDYAELDLLGSGTIEKTLAEWTRDTFAAEEKAAAVTESDVGRRSD